MPNVKGIDSIGVCVVYCCSDGKGNIAMARRSNKTRDEHGRWDIGGGGLRFDETVESALRREVKEEYDADVASSHFLGFRDVHRKHDGKQTHWIALDYAVLVDRNTVRLNEPEMFDDFGWFTLTNLPHPLHSQLTHFLQKYSDKLWK